mmetsp:Transcript_28520/g.74914  ORF Transcript_28520/g.74914 Transcript_28520/m.74914 type:complete len:228 (+) Transcript_28520:1115-1798(+)
MKHATRLPQDAVLSRTPKTSTGPATSMRRPGVTHLRPRGGTGPPFSSRLERVNRARACSGSSATAGRSRQRHSRTLSCQGLPCGGVPFATARVPWAPPLAKSPRSATRRRAVRCVRPIPSVGPSHSWRTSRRASCRWTVDRQRLARSAQVVQRGHQSHLLRHHHPCRPHLRRRPTTVQLPECTSLGCLLSSNLRCRTRTTRIPSLQCGGNSLCAPQIRLGAAARRRI